MRGVRLFPELRAMQPKLLLAPSTLLILAANLLPLLGVVYWGWDTFLVVMLFWMETVIFAFWAMVSILLGVPATEKETPSLGGRVALVIFFTLHSGLFMLVHFLFLWAMFSGDWRSEIRGAEDFYSKIVVAAGLWLPLMVSFIGRGVATLADRAPELSALSAPIVKQKTSAEDEEESNGAVGPLYVRIVILHLVIIAGAWLAQTFGSVAPFILLILFKTAVDLSFHLAAEAKARRKTLMV